MLLKLITPPSSEPITTRDLVTHLRLDDSGVEQGLLSALITAARGHVEDVTGAALLTQTWDYFLNEWPGCNFIKLPLGNLQSVTSIKWKDTAGTETTLTAVTDYLVETNGVQCGRIVLPYGKTWPSGELYPSNPIAIRYVCGWTAASLIPAKIIAAVKLIATGLYEQRGEPVVGQTVVENKSAEWLLSSSRLWDEF